MESEASHFHAPNYCSQTGAPNASQGAAPNASQLEGPIASQTAAPSEAPSVAPTGSRKAARKTKSKPPSQTCSEKESKGKGSNYRVWSPDEEKAFIDAMKVAKSTGYKSPKGFKPGAMTIMLAYMKEVFPGTDLVVQPHIKTKLKTWSQIHKGLLHMHEQSVIGWCPETKKFLCEEETWKFHAKVTYFF